MTTTAKPFDQSQTVSQDNTRIHRNQSLFVSSVLMPLLFFMAIWIFIPILWVFIMAFFNYSPLADGGSFLGLGGENNFVGIEHFRTMFSDTLTGRNFRISLENTVIFSGLVLPLNLIITLTIAMSIESVHRPLRQVFRFIYFLPVVTSSVAVALIWSYIYHPQQGLFNAALQQVGLPRQIWLTNPRSEPLGVPLAMWSVIITYLWRDIGYNILIFSAAIRNIPDQFKEAARVDGATPIQTFFFVILPLLKPTLLLVSVLTMIDAFKVFDLIQVMTNGNPQGQTRVLMLDLYQNGFRSQDMGFASAESLVLFGIVLILTVVQMRFLRTRWEY